MSADKFAYRSSCAQARTTLYDCRIVIDKKGALHVLQALFLYAMSRQPLFLGDKSIDSID